MGYAEFGGDVYEPQTAQTAPAARPQTRSDHSTAAGTAQRVTFNPGPAAYWLVRRMIVLSDTPGECRVYLGTVSDENQISGTYSGDFDENDANQPYLVPESTALIFEWPSGGACHARIEFEEVYV